MIRLYDVFAEDILTRKRTVGDFAHAARLSQLLEDIMHSSVKDHRIAKGNWPTV